MPNDYVKRESAEAYFVPSTLRYFGFGFPETVLCWVAGCALAVFFGQAVLGKVPSYTIAVSIVCGGAIGHLILLLRFRANATLRLTNDLVVGPTASLKKQVALPRAELNIRTTWAGNILIESEGLPRIYFRRTWLAKQERESLIQLLRRKF